MTKNNTTEWKKQWIDAGQTDCHLLLNKNKTMYVRKDISDQARLQEHKDTLERERERFKRILNDHRYKKIEVDAIFRCLLLDIDDDYKDDSLASSAINEEINKTI